MKGEIKSIFLQVIERGINHYEEMWLAWQAMPFRGRVVWPKGIRRAMWKKKNENDKKQLEREQRLMWSQMIYKLKKEGLIENKSSIFRLTKAGAEKLKVLKKMIFNKDLPLSTSYNKIEDNALKIISYDIPEKFCHKRNWLRSVLKNLDFKPAHKSLWYGKTVMPKKLIDDLVRLKIFSFVKIFSVNKSGNLEQIN